VVSCTGVEALEGAGETCIGLTKGAGESSTAVDKVVGEGESCTSLREVPRLADASSNVANKMRAAIFAA
jgi:hypothetical protein